MKFRGGLNVPVLGDPSMMVRQMPIPDCLYLPLFSRRLRFSRIVVTDNEYVEKGQILATASGQFEIPLFAPTCGVVKLSEVNDHIVLRTQVQDTSNNDVNDWNSEKAFALLSSNVMPNIKCIEDDLVPDPASNPDQFLIIGFSTEPCFTNSLAGIDPKDICLRTGIQELISRSNTGTVHIVLSAKWKVFNKELSDNFKGIDGIIFHEIPHKYPFDNMRLLARLLGVDSGKIRSCGLKDVASLGLYASTGKISFTRIIAVTGPDIRDALHVSIVDGYPIDLLIKEFGITKPVRVVNGGVFSGSVFPETQRGIDIECQGITLIPEETERELLPFIKPGYSRYSYSRSFLGSLRFKMKEKSTTSLRGEHRPCISCSFCEDVCPAGLLPLQLNRYIQGKMLEQAQRLRIDLCIGCGLCSYVCPSKIDVASNIADGLQQIKVEMGLIENSVEGEKKLIQPLRSKYDAVS